MTDPYAPDFEIVPCCVHLRTKPQRGPDGRPVRRGYIPVSTTSAYWCDRTAASFGPDDAPGTPDRCQPGRTCFAQM